MSPGLKNVTQMLQYEWFKCQSCFWVLLIVCGSSSFQHVAKRLHDNWCWQVKLNLDCQFLSLHKTRVGRSVRRGHYLHDMITCTVLQPSCSSLHWIHLVINERLLNVLTDLAAVTRQDTSVKLCVLARALFGRSACREFTESSKESEQSVWLYVKIQIMYVFLQ